MSDDTERTKRSWLGGPTRKVDEEKTPTEDGLRGATRKIAASPSQPPARTPAPVRGARSDATRLAGPASRGDDQSASVEYVTGWLVVVDGPGRGSSVPLGYGLNTIGRGGGQRVSLNFGDEQISRETHCSIAYDHINRKFLIQHGGGQNLTYMGGEPVLTPAPLEAGASILLGKTTLRFIPFCGADFDWDVDPSASSD